MGVMAAVGRVASSAWKVTGMLDIQLSKNDLIALMRLFEFNVIIIAITANVNSVNNKYAIISVYKVLV